VSIDLWKPYQSLVEEMMPKATVVADKFHVIKLLNDELDEQRKVEKRADKKITNKTERERVSKEITGSKYALLKNEEELNERDREKLEEVSEVSFTLAEMHRLKEEFRDIFDKSSNWVEGTLELLNFQSISSLCVTHPKVDRVSLVRILVSFNFQSSQLCLVQQSPIPDKLPSLKKFGSISS